MEAPASLKRVFDPRNSGREMNVQLFSDEPIGDAGEDYFGFSSFAAALAEIIDNEETGTPLTIALSAPWGAGKTSVARMIVGDLEERVANRRGARQRIVCEFNAWEHNDAPHLGAALAARVAKVANEHRPRWRRLWEPLPSAMLEPKERWWRVLWLAAIAAVAAGLLMAFPPTREVADAFFDPGEAAVGIFGLAWLLTMIWGALFKVGRNATRFVDEPGSEAARGSIAEVKTQLGRLISQAIREGRMVIFVDDLERCRAARAVEVFEVAGQLLAHKGVVTVLLADMRALAEAASAAYKAESGKDSDPELGRRYMEKLVQLQLQLPPPAADDMVLLLGGDRPATRETQRTDGDSEPTLSKPAREYEKSVSMVSAAGTAVACVTAALVLIGGGNIATAAFAATTIGLAVAVIGASIGALILLWERYRRRRVTARVKETLRKNPAISKDDTERESLAREAAGDEKYEPLALQVAESLHTVESSEIEAVEAVIKRHPPRFPRSAKRMINHARLQTKIAREREMFGGEPKLTPAHLGKWIVLSERWPAFADQVAQNPTTIGDVESPPLAGPLSVHIPKDESGNHDNEFIGLIEEEPQLAELVKRLIYFQSAPGNGLRVEP